MTTRLVLLSLTALSLLQHSVDEDGRRHLTVLGGRHNLVNRHDAVYKIRAIKAIRALAHFRSVE